MLFFEDMMNRIIKSTKVDQQTAIDRLLDKKSIFDSNKKIGNHLQLLKQTIFMSQISAHLSKQKTTSSLSGKPGGNSQQNQNDSKRTCRH